MCPPHCTYIPSNYPNILIIQCTYFRHISPYISCMKAMTSKCDQQHCTNTLLNYISHYLHMPLIKYDYHNANIYRTAILQFSTYGIYILLHIYQTINNCNIYFTSYCHVSEINKLSKLHMHETYVNCLIHIYVDICT